VREFVGGFSSILGVHVGDPTSTKDEDNSLDINGCKPHPH